MRLPSRRLRRIALVCFACAASLAAADRRLLTPAGAAKPIGPYSPALDLGEMVYVSGQGALDAQGKMPTGLEAQAALTIANVRANLAAAGLDFHHVVAAQLYVSDFSTFPAVEKLWKQAVPAPGPATIRMGVARMPAGTTVEITVVAVKDRRKSRFPRYLDGVYGATRAEVEAKLRKAAPQGLAALTLYSTESREPGVLPVTALPGGARWAAFAVASAGKPANTVYCNVVESSSGAVEAQTEQAFEKLKACLAGQGATLAGLVATNVWLDDIEQFSRMNAVYARQFSGAFPTRTTVQPGAKAAGPAVRISGVAVK
jgi:2-iminobutanoate/2-iminopropanoate deaminase